MGVQTLKNAVILATAVVAAVILIQGAGPSVSALPTRASADIVAGSASSSTSASTNSVSQLLRSGTAPAEVAASKSAPKPATVAEPAVSAPATTQVTAASATSSSAATAGRTFTTTPAHMTVAATPPPTAPVCATAIGGSTAGAPGASDASGIPGTTSADLAAFAAQYNAIRVANCLTPIPFANIRYSSCLQDRMWWMADDPSTNSASAWGHTGTAVRSDGVPITGCDGDLAGGTGYTGASVATAWWGSADHRASLFQPLYSGNVGGVCIAFAMSHGGVNVPAPNEPASFVRAAAYWYGC
jgi:hypothetical protein